MGSTWITLWLLHFYHEYIKWEMLELHFGYYIFTMNTINGKYLDYIMVTTFLPLVQ